jgi:methionine--tRNA ligase beta chain
MLNYDDFKKLDIKIGKILEAEIVPEADRLLKFKVDMGNGDVRQIISGVREHYPDPQTLMGKSVPVVANLEPRMIKGIESQGMILYVAGEGENFTTLEPNKSVPPGTAVR